MKNILVIGSTGQIGSELTKNYVQSTETVMLLQVTLRVLSLLANWPNQVLWLNVM